MATIKYKTVWLAEDDSEHDSEDLATMHEKRTAFQVEAASLNEAIKRACMGSGWAGSVVDNFSARITQSAAPLYAALQSYLAAQEEYQAAKELVE